MCGNSIIYIVVAVRRCAFDFEHDLKSGSNHAFAKRHSLKNF